MDFVARTERLYTKESMSYNVHQLLHITQCVRNWGPFWTQNGYPFESGNGMIRKSIHAAKGVISQICRNLFMKQSIVILEKHIQVTVEDSTVLTFRRELVNQYTHNTAKLSGI